MPIKLLFLILFIGMLPASSFANDRFIAICKKDMEYFQHDWLSKVFNVGWDCKKIDAKISQANSFEELLPDISRANVINDWLGIIRPNFKFGIEGPSNYGLLRNLFSDLDDFIGFENLKHISLVDRVYNKPCEIVAKFPHLRRMTLMRNDFYKEGVDECLSAAGIEGVYLLDEKEWTNKERVVLPVVETKTPVLGIEHWIGKLDPLAKLKSLKYLDYDRIEGVNGLELLKDIRSLTHLSMGDAVVQNFEHVRLLRELRFLIMKDFQRTSPERKIEDISFLKDLSLLKKLVLTDNKIRDISVLKKLKNLEYVDLEGNEIEFVPDLSALTKLSYLDLNDNKITTIEDFAATGALTYLNLGLNRISDFSTLTRAPNLKALNISGNALVQTLTVPSLPKLKLLFLDGGDGIERSSFEEATTYHLKKVLSPEVLDLLPIRYVNLFNDEESCVTRKTFEELAPLPEMPELEVISFKNQKMHELPDLSRLKALKFLNVAGNGFPTDISVSHIPSLKVLHVGDRDNRDIDPRDVTEGDLVRIRYENITNSFSCFFGPGKTGFSQ